MLNIYLAVQNSVDFNYSISKKHCLEFVLHQEKQSVTNNIIDLNLNICIRKRALTGRPTQKNFNVRKFSFCCRRNFFLFLQLLHCSQRQLGLRVGSIGSLLIFDVFSLIGCSLFHDVYFLEWCRPRCSLSDGGHPSEDWFFQ